jgi:hypothetical protein
MGSGSSGKIETDSGKLSELTAASEEEEEEDDDDEEEDDDDENTDGCAGSKGKDKKGEDTAGVTKRPACWGCGEALWLRPLSVAVEVCRHAPRPVIGSRSFCAPASLRRCAPGGP